MRSIEPSIWSRSSSSKVDAALPAQICNSVTIEISGTSEFTYVENKTIRAPEVPSKFRSAANL
jgi:hypothetical protein